MEVAIALTGTFKNNKTRSVIIERHIDEKVSLLDEMDLKMGVIENISQVIDKLTKLKIKYIIVYENTFFKPIEHSEDLELDMACVQRAIDRIILEVNRLISSYSEDCKRH